MSKDWRGYSLICWLVLSLSSDGDRTGEKVSIWRAQFLQQPGDVLKLGTAVAPGLRVLRRGHNHPTGRKEVPQPRILRRRQH